MSFTFRTLALIAVAGLPCALGQGGVLGTWSADGKIHFQAIEELQIEGAHRVRLMPVATEQIALDDAKRFPRVELAQIGTIRGDAKHRIVRLDDSGKPVEVILPDSFAPKSPVDASFAQGRLAIEALQSKKDKSGDLIAPERFFVFISGPEPDRLALTFVNRESAFLNVDEQMTAMEGLAASFPDSPVKEELRAQLQERLAAGLAAFDNRGPYDGLLLTRRWADLAGRAFPGDAALGKLAGTIASRIQFIETTRPALHSLAASEEWDLLLQAYLPFEPYQWSFPDMIALRQTALEESARLHAHRGALLAERQMNTDALRELNQAKLRDPENRQIAKMFDTARLVGSVADAAAAKPRVLTAGSSEDLRFKRSLHDAERAIGDKDFAKAETAIHDAQTENKEAPDILVLQAKLLAARGRDAEALPLLDAYDREVSEPPAREAGNTARNDILYDLEEKGTALRQELQKLQQAGEYSKLRAAANQALELDPEDEDFLYFSGAAASIFRDNSAAKEHLERYLVRSNSLRGDLQARGRALRILSLLNPPAQPQPAGTPNWLSGRPLAEGVYYCPVSGAFQLPIDSIAGYKLKMSFQWDGNLLNAIATNFDDEKGAQNYHSMNGPGDPQGNFFFAYGPQAGQVQVASTQKFDTPPALAELRVSHEGAPHLVDARGRARIVLQDSPEFNLAVLGVLEGPLAAGIAGNSYFNPFIWDGLHYFSLSWDAQGRLSTAREWNADNLVRFTWSGDRLTEIRAFRKDAITPYYQRTISYSGTMISAESYSQANKTGQIKYVYSGKVLQQVKVEDGGVHDGKTWTVRMR